jgi:predicted SnoaL-like aldol condensation-catalyzing enzyme
MPSDSMTDTKTYDKGAFNMLGTVSNVQHKTDKNGKAYVVAKFTTMLKGKQQTRTLMASGKALEARTLRDGTVVDALLPQLVDGASIRIYAVFDRAPGTDGKAGGEFISAIGLGLPPKAQAA